MVSLRTLVSSLGFSLATTSVLAASSGNSSSTPPIVVKGNAFFDSSSGERFYIRGVDYQPGGSSNLTDPLSDKTICERDIPVFQDLGINTIRVYTVDNSVDHSDCMKMLQDAGIYLILDVNTPGSSISRINPACSYNADYLQSVFATVDAFAEYDNVLGFFAGNEVINMPNNTNTATYVKAVVRDMKKYIKARNYRQIPVGYSAADIVSNRQLAAEYFNCGNDSDARIDMFGVNDYSWCGDSSFVVSGYKTKVDLYKDYSVPIFLSEFGCNEVPGARPFTEIAAIYSTQMSSVFSGGLVYEYSNETNNYGLVQIESDTEVKKLQDFENLKNEYASNANPEGDGGYSESNQYSTCPDFVKDVWEANNTLPEMPSAASVYFETGAGAAFGTGINTQNSCEKDDDDVDDDNDDDTESSSSSQSSESTEASSSTVDSSTSTESSSSSSATSSTLSTSVSSTSSSASTSSKGKKNKNAAGALKAPTFFIAVLELINFLL
ncbi:1,3-beta-glucanosyltransferase GAS5 [Nakaseomyces bracarensis]|uniref:1,3-beta-glucanosyltransferase n=1 Tax=Nakaseomyces bracarensis TaxID=273131 RepID=A0ABR4NZ53_9SACH